MPLTSITCILGSMHNSKLITALSLAITLAVSAYANDTPKRVVSMNLCTDQLAMMLAAPGQLHSVSYLAIDPRGSAMAEEARNYRINHGLAEEIYLLQPDLVIAGSFSTHATIDMLEQLGIPVAVFKPAYGLDDVRDRIRQMGDVLGREENSQTLIADYNHRLDILQEETKYRPKAALYYANGYTSGDRTLAGQILTAAGFENVAAKAGYSTGGILPLEVLAMLQPEVLITGQRYPGASRSEEILDHPVLQRLAVGSTKGAISDRDWVCGTPYVLRAIEELSTIRREIVRD